MIHDLALLSIGLASGLVFVALDHIGVKRRWRDHCRAMRIVWRMLQDERTRDDALGVIDTVAKQGEGP